MKKFLFVLIVLFVYSFLIEPNLLIVKRYSINNKQLSGIKIVFVGDFHIKPNQKTRLRRVVNLINQQQPDIVLSVGDFVNGQQEKMTLSIADIVKELKNIKSKYGFYTVLGNHDWWTNGKKIAKTLSKNNIKVLANSNVKLTINDKNVYIAGVEDITTRTPYINKALAKTQSPVILLSHSPDIFPSVPNNVTLTLAGHTHGGQIRLPLLGAIIVPSNYGNKYSQGLIEENGKKMIVTKGIGTSTLPVRFNCIPEIIVIDFK